jgi:hypothetical protein
MVRKLEPAVLIRCGLRNVYDKKVAKGTLDNSHLLVESQELGRSEQEMFSGGCAQREGRSRGENLMTAKAA